MASSPPQLQWCLAVVGHPVPRHLGAHARLPSASGIVLGRARDCFGRGALDHPSVAPNHAVIEVTDDATDEGGVAVHALSSGHLTRVDGRGVDSRRLVVGDVVEVGEVLLRVQRVPQGLTPRPDDDLHGVSPEHARLLEAVDRAAAGRRPVLVRGEAGTGKRAVASALHRRRGRPGKVIAVDARRLVAADVDDAREGTLVLRGLDALPIETRQRVVADAFRRAAARLADVVLTTRSRGLACDAAGLAPRTVEVPALRERPQDIPVIASALMQRHVGQARALRSDATLTMLRHAWPGNVAELDAVLRRGLRAAPAHGPLALAEELSGPWSIEEDAAPEDLGPLVAGPTWFQSSASAAVSLEGRPALCRVYAALQRRRVERPGEPVSVGEILAEGWPGERVLARAGANRVYVALTTLRKLGLRHAILRTKRGYLLDPERVSVDEVAGAA